MPCKYYDKEEIISALRALSDEDIDQMLRFTRFRLMRNTARTAGVEAEDLFIDAAIRTIEQKRRWKREVSLFNHFVAVMRSIGHRRLKQASRYTRLNELVAAPQDWSPSALDAQNDIGRLRAQLRGDGIALDILGTMMDEMRPRDAQRLLGISVEVYWAARKRIRRQATNLPGAPAQAARTQTLSPMLLKAMLSMP
jgi:hypothetical protein